MKHSRLAPGLLTLAVGLTAALAAFGRSADSAAAPDIAAPGTNPQAMAQSVNNENCYVHLFDDDNFKDDNIVVKGPGRFANLSGLPGAEEDWTGDANSFKVGPSATVEMWPEPNFKGTSRTYQPGSQVPSVEDEPESMEIRC